MPTLSMELERFGEVSVEFSTAPAEPDVGIMSTSIDGFTVRDQEGEVIQLTDAEEEVVINRCSDWLMDNEGIDE